MHVPKSLLIFFCLKFFFVNASTSVFQIPRSDFERLMPRVSAQDLTIILQKIYNAEAKFTADASRMYYPEVAKRITAVHAKIGVEVGTLYGGLADFLLSRTAISKLTVVDPFAPAFFNNEIVAEVLHEKALKRLARFKERASLVRKYSLDAVKDFEPNSLDFVFIDGDHTYDAVSKDIKAWYEKVRPGGLVMGDDYYVEFPGVIRAVNELCKTHALRRYNTGTSGRIWCVIKRR